MSESETEQNKCQLELLFYSLNFPPKINKLFYLSVKNQKPRIYKITEDLKAREYLLILKYWRSASADMSKAIPELSTMADN